MNTTEYFSINTADIKTNLSCLAVTLLVVFSVTGELKQKLWKLNICTVQLSMCLWRFVLFYYFQVRAALRFPWLFQGPVLGHISM